MRKFAVVSTVKIKRFCDVEAETIEEAGEKAKVLHRQPGSSSTFPHQESHPKLVVYEWEGDKLNLDKKLEIIP